MSYSSVGLVWDIESFREHIAGINLSWARGVTLHHTAAPSLDQRPKGWTATHMRNLANYYGKERKWKAGPHLFIDEDQAWGLSPLSDPGTHARSFNRTHIGIEVLGDFDTESARSGRGLECWKMAAGITAALIDAMPGGAGGWNFHRDDPRTNKTCPGRHVGREWFGELVDESKAPDMGIPISPTDDRESDSEEHSKAIRAIEWQLTKLKRALGT